MSFIVLLIVLSAVTYRVGRFIILDTLIDEPREAVMVWLEERSNRLVFSKLYDLLTCPWCLTIWIAAAVVSIHNQFIDGLPSPVWTWLAVATGSLVFWRLVDPE